MKPLKHSDYIKAYLAYQLGTPILGGFLGVFIGIILGTILAAAQIPLSQSKIIVAVVMLAFSIPFSYVMFRLIVRKFLVSKIGEENPPAL